ncbi:hypothetical protein TRFO_43184 [Tritrichomonas foetus]|uniref:Uncharacterized protein n=1 Tax=Tritrichomonas foetus TaxID=1144522 RepID=A0A1J4KRU9_9EUKA|nr:hypothetical protein TRFO_43184 [Tritrichomonas foetus]|eukprot:OHT13999.1 hypothetical protein TRFO_43184 [Tritrichomonas foetus]
MQLENKIQTNSNRTDKHQEFLQTIVSSLGLLNCNTNIPLFESTMANSINNSTIFVNNELAELHKELDKLKDQIQIQNIMNKQKPNQVIITTPQSPPKPIQTAPPPTNEKVVNPSKIIKMKAPDISNINTNISKEFDFSTVKPYGQVTVHWRDPPDLPPIHPFRNMHDFVDYFYQMIPKLQAHLTAIQQKVVENASDILGKVDKSHVEKMFEKFQNMVNELRNRLLDLKDACEQTATREEINEMINDLLLQMNNDGETAIGRVKCIACGRDTGIVTGAKTEYEIQRILGQPPNSIAFRASNNCSTGVSGSAIGVSFSKRDGFDSEIVESPRSIRPFRPKANKMKIPKLPTP